jgi:AcrR family transcriptional regulator
VGDERDIDMNAATPEATGTVSGPIPDSGEVSCEPCRPLRADAARNRERILAAASEVFARRGLDATLDDVAERAGVGVGTVYRRFPNKDALVEALFEKEITRIIDLAVAAGETDDPWEGLVWFLEHATAMQIDDLGLRDVLLHSEYGRERVALAKERIEPAVGVLVERARRDGSLRSDFVTADVPIVELMLSTVALYTGEIDPDLWRRYLGIMLDGMVARRSSHRPLPPGPSIEAMEHALHSRRRT